MQYKSVMNSIERGVLAPVYLLCGEEDYLQEAILRALKDKLIHPDYGSFNLDELNGEKLTAGQIVQSAEALPVFAEKRLVIVANPLFLKTKRKDSAKNKEQAEENEEENKGENEEDNKAEDKGENEAGSGKNDGHDNVRHNDQDNRDASVEERAILEYLADPLSSTCLVFWVKGSVDKRKKVFKAIAKAGIVLEIKPRKGSELNSWLFNEARLLGKKLEPKALEYIVLSSNNSLRQLKSELTKLALYSGNEETITRATAEKLLAKTSEASIFVLVDNIGLRNAEIALLELRSLLESGEAPLKVLYMIARQFRLMLLVKDLSGRGLTEKQTTAELSLHPFVTGKILRQAARFTFAELENALAKLLACDLAIKTGAPSDVSLEGVILELVSGKQVTSGAQRRGGADERN